MSSCCAQEKLCASVKKTKSVLEEMVSDHPWVWVIGVGIVGLLIGRRKKNKKC